MIKRLFDMTASLIGLILLSPILLLIGLCNWITLPCEPIIFKQQRVGRYGKLFTLIKFRTMYPHPVGSSITVLGEDRITPLGRFLRKYKLDELPELLNVLVGDMSLVGPRPDVPGYADKLMGSNKKILELRPGLTGPATLKYAGEEELLSTQSDPVKYNDEVIYPDKVRINLSYLENQSFYLDMKIIMKTILHLKLKEPWAQ